MGGIIDGHLLFGPKYNIYAVDKKIHLLKTCWSKNSWSTFIFSFSPLFVLQVVADINALSLLHLQIMMTLFLSGLILKALLGPLPFALIVFLIECERGAILIAIGWYNASALLQFFIIHNQR